MSWSKCFCHRASLAISLFVVTGSMELLIVPTPRRRHRCSSRLPYPLTNTHGSRAALLSYRQ